MVECVSTLVMSFLIMEPTKPGLLKARAIRAQSPVWLIAKDLHFPIVVAEVYST